MVNVYAPERRLVQFKKMYDFLVKIVCRYIGILRYIMETPRMQTFLCLSFYVIMIEGAYVCVHTALII